MAEVVNRHLQSMADEIGEMRRLGLFTKNELGVILKSRKDFEYKINGVHKNLPDFKDYILYEKALLKQIHLRRDKNKIAEKKGGIEYKIIKRIKNLYEIAMHRFPTEFPLYQQYFNFCKMSNYKSGVANVIQNMLKNVSHNENVWQVAAHWHAYDQKNINLAKKTIYKGLSLHKNSTILYSEAFKLVLSEAESESDKQRIIEELNTYVGLIIKDMKDADYLVEILSLLQKYPFSEKIQNRIIEELLNNYSDKEFVWYTLAEREMNGFHYGELTEEAVDPLFACFEVYRKGLTKLEGNEKAILYEKYLDTLITTQREKSNESKWKDALQAALQQASDEKFLSEKYYITWFECASDAKAQEILKKGTSDLPQSIDLWKLRLRLATMDEKNSDVNVIFKEGRSALKEKSLPLWLMYIRYYSLLFRDDKVVEAYKEGVEQDEEICQKLKPRYLEFLALHKGIKETRAAYKVLAHKRPYCKELHSTMSKLESAEITYDLEVWSQVHELACKQFGDDDVDVWINHIMFYLQFNKKAPKFQQTIQSIYSNAEKMLNPLLLPDFKEKYVLESAKLQ